MATLPYEILLDIFEHYTPRGPERHILAVCARVCRGWAAPAQHVLYRSVVLTERTKLLAFDSAATRMRSKHLASHVRYLHITHLVARYEGITSRDFAKVVSALPNLFHIVLDLDWGSFDHQTLSRLRSATACITALEIMCSNSINLSHFLEIWPNIKHLRVRYSQWPAKHRPRPHCRFYEYDHQETFATRTMPTLPWILSPASANTLRILSIRPLPVNDILGSLLATHGPHLRSLRIATCNDHVAKCLADCTSLEELIIDDIPTSAIMQSLPTSLEHLQFDQYRALQRSGASRLTHITNFITRCRKTHKHLRVITCNGFQLEEVSLLRRECDLLEIEFRYFLTKIWEFPLERQPIGPIQQFPRRGFISPARPPADSRY